MNKKAQDDSWWENNSGSSFRKRCLIVKYSEKVRSDKKLYKWANKNNKKLLKEK